MKSLEARIAEVAETAAREAGDVLRSYRGRDLKVDEATGHDVKLEVDVLAERTIIDTISSVFPEHTILGEESGTIEGDDGYLWIIDPLDGTVNFFYGLPYYCVSVACYAQLGGRPQETSTIDSLGRPIVGVVYAPPTDDLFVGRDGLGATLNGQAIRAAEVKDLRDSIVCLGFGKSDELGLRMANSSVRLADRVRKLRCMGAAAYDIANVACGRMSAFFEESIRTWDIAAAYVILKEAGGLLDAEEFEPTRWRTLACAPCIREQLKPLLLTAS